MKHPVCPGLLRGSWLVLLTWMALPLCYAQVYQVSVLPTLSGKATNKNPNRAYAINASGQVTGVSSGESVVWTAGSGIADIGQNECAGCVPVGGINDQGNAVGLMRDGAFFWTAFGGAQFLGSQAQPSGVNNSDQVTGEFPTGQNADAHAFLWSPQTLILQDLGTLGGKISFAYGINDSAQVVGFSVNHSEVEFPFIWSEDTGMQAIPRPFNAAYAINNQGQVAGTAGGDAAIWSQTGGTQDLGALPGALGSRAVAISNRGTVVGVSGGFVFFWSPTLGMVNVNSLCHNANQNWTAVGVNSAGQIVANKKGGNVVLITPVIAVALSSSQNPSQAGQTVTFSATASSIAGFAPDGETITFLDSTTVLGTAPLVNGSASIALSNLATGVHLVRAKYSGDVNYFAATSKVLRQKVTP